MNAGLMFHFGVDSQSGDDVEWTWFVSRRGCAVEKSNFICLIMRADT